MRIRSVYGQRRPLIEKEADTEQLETQHILLFLSATQVADLVTYHFR